ncbi:MAG: hypothetical protein WBR18_13835 [Anaerolineales bacterium]
MPAGRVPKVAVYKFSSCDGCQLTLLNLEDELLSLAGQVEFAYFLEASSRTAPGPYDLVLVEGSVSTPEERQRIQRVREQAGTLVALGTCATAGGIQALRNFTDVNELAAEVYPDPTVLQVLPTSSPLSDHVKVDIELWGCPINKGQLLEVVAAVLQGRSPSLARTAVCAECKRTGAACVLVADGVACLGPLTRSGCGALCPNAGRGCYGCFGPVPEAQVEAMIPILRAHQRYPGEAIHLLRHVSANAPAFRQAAALLAKGEAKA